VGALDMDSGIVEADSETAEEDIPVAPLEDSETAEKEGIPVDSDIVEDILAVDMDMESFEEGTFLVDMEVNRMDIQLQ